MMRNIFLILLMLSLLVQPACKKTGEADVPQGWEGSVFIVNEGPFQTGTGSISGFKPHLGRVFNGVFEKVNGRPLGNIVQSVYVSDNKVFIVVNNANKVEIADFDTFISLGQIDSVTLPRYFISSDQVKGYLSCWDNTVKVIDMESLEVVKSLAAGSGPDKMALVGGRLFVINTGGFGVDSTVTVIDTGPDEVVRTINVGHRPGGLQADGNGSLWVLCSGRGWNGFPSPDDTPGRLVKIDASTMEINEEEVFPGSDVHPENLAMDHAHQVLYYNYGQGIYAYEAGSGSLPGEPLVDRGKAYYGLGFDKKARLIYASDPIDYLQDGWVYRFYATDGSPVDSFRVGVIPNGFWFNE